MYRQIGGVGGGPTEEPWHFVFLMALRQRKMAVPELGCLENSEDSGSRPFKAGVPFKGGYKDYCKGYYGGLV